MPGSLLLTKYSAELIDSIPDENYNISVTKLLENSRKIHCTGREICHALIDVVYRGGT
jgi:hypothetical protein